jgi:hypothetical protein
METSQTHTNFVKNSILCLKSYKYAMKLNSYFMFDNFQLDKIYTRRCLRTKVSTLDHCLQLQILNSSLTYGIIWR